MSLPGPDWSAAEIIAHLRSIGTEANRAGMARFGINTATALGVGNSDLRPLARKLRKNHERALLLWESNIREARLLAAFTADARKLTPDQCRRWSGDFDSWEIVDGVADLFAETPFWRELVAVFAADEREFVRRTAFAMLAWAAVHLKKEPDATFISFAHRNACRRRAQFRPQGGELGAATDRQAVDIAACPRPCVEQETCRIRRQVGALDR